MITRRFRVQLVREYEIVLEGEDSQVMARRAVEIAEGGFVGLTPVRERLDWLSSEIVVEDTEGER